MNHAEPDLSRSLVEPGIMDVCRNSLFANVDESRLSDFSNAAGGNGAEDRNLVEQAPEMTSMLLLK